MAVDEHLANRIRDIVGKERGLREQRMFGGIAFLINGNMAVAASGRGGLLVRVPPEDTEKLVKSPHADRFAMGKRAMDGWLRMEEEGVRTKRQLERWTGIGVAYARSLPKKPKK